MLRGRRVAPERVEEVAHHYEHFGGVSPLTELTRAQAAGLGERLRAAGLDLPVYVGMRNWHPFLADTLAEMSRAGVAGRSGSSPPPTAAIRVACSIARTCATRRATLAEKGLPDIEIVYVGDWHTHPGYIEASAQEAERAVRSLPRLVRSRATLVFTAHSIPGEHGGSAIRTRSSTRRRRD